MNKLETSCLSGKTYEMAKLLIFQSAIIAFLFTNQTSASAKEIDWNKKLSKGYQQLTMGNTEQAEAIFSKIIQKYPTSAPCHTALGQTYKRLGKFDAARAEFVKATALDPNYAKAFYELGSLEEFDKHWAEAATAFERYLQLEPSTSERQALADRIKFCRSQLQ